jgi:phosphopantothenoylcysteine decarboxylase / phosphopantothenate---cysteine ligase
MLQGKKILLGVTGSIAAYKTPELVRQLVKLGANVKVIVTEAASDFVSPLVLSTVSKNKIHTSFYSEDKSAWNNHVELALWADFFLVAPASANTIAKMATGFCDNMLTAVYLSAKCHVAIAPAMDVDMYRHNATQKNIASLKENKIQVIGPDAGELASGLNGAGRMTEPEEIVKAIDIFFNQRKELAGKTVLVTTGPTYEAIDPVRFIGNHSSGKMGVAIANELCAKGANVILVAGPGVGVLYNKGIKRIDVTSAESMYKAVHKYFSKCNAAVMAAAVADFTPVTVAKNKIKKNSETAMMVELKSTKDIVSSLGAIKKKNQILVGFALETDNEIENAKKKLKNKNLDFIVLNSFNEKNRVFNADVNQISIISKNNKVKYYESKPKNEVAVDIVNEMCSLLK